MKSKVRNKKEYRRKRRHMSIRRKVKGTSERPRACVFRSNGHIYAQLIDDTAGQTIASASSLKAKGTPTESAKAVGKQLAELAKEKGITQIRFDRGGYLYHGRVAALAESMRENGLEF